MAMLGKNKAEGMWQSNQPKSPLSCVAEEGAGSSPTRVVSQPRLLSVGGSADSFEAPPASRSDGENQSRWRGFDSRTSIRGKGGDNWSVSTDTSLVGTGKESEEGAVCAERGGVGAACESGKERIREGRESSCPAPCRQENTGSGSSIVSEDENDGGGFGGDDDDNDDDDDDDDSTVPARDSASLALEYNNSYLASFMVSARVCQSRVYLTCRCRLGGGLLRCALELLLSMAHVIKSSLSALLVIVTFGTCYQASTLCAFCICNVSRQKETV